LRVFGLLLIIMGFSGPAYSQGDPDFLENLSHKAFLYFLEHSDPHTGLVLDRSPTDGQNISGNNVASIAATGFGLTAFVLASENNWISREVARVHILNSLRFLRSDQFRVHGWYYHWLDSKTGEPLTESEVSSIDTSFFLAGVLTARQYFFDDPEIMKIATDIYEGVDFNWMLNGSHLFSHGWFPKSGFINYKWDSYSELMLLYVLGIASPTHGIDPSSWSAWTREKINYKGLEYVQSYGSLFIHQYSHAWLDLRGLHENFGDHINWFENSKNAVLANREFCLSLAGEFHTYSEDAWGITASDSPYGYVAWGGPPRDSHIDGTMVPSALTGSLMFLNDEVLRPLKKMAEQNPKVISHYGFVNAFNPLTGWMAPDTLGIDAGITLLSIENMRRTLVWKYFMKNPEISTTFERIGLIPTK
jgi:hypothetical protein